MTFGSALLATLMLIDVSTWGKGCTSGTFFSFDPSPMIPTATFSVKMFICKKGRAFIQPILPLYFPHKMIRHSPTKSFVIGSPINGRLARGVENLTAISLRNQSKFLPHKKRA
jgi:hypothetical protein